MRVCSVYLWHQQFDCPLWAWEHDPNVTASVHRPCQAAGLSLTPAVLSAFSFWCLSLFAREFCFCSVRSTCPHRLSALCPFALDLLGAWQAKEDLAAVLQELPPDYRVKIGQYLQAYLTGYADLRASHTGYLALHACRLFVTTHTCSCACVCMCVCVCVCSAAVMVQNLSSVLQKIDSTTRAKIERCIGESRSSQHLISQHGEERGKGRQRQGETNTQTHTHARTDTHTHTCSATLCNAM